jgi:hypothetical protein
MLYMVLSHFVGIQAPGNGRSSASGVFFVNQRQVSPVGQVHYLRRC